MKLRKKHSAYGSWCNMRKRCTNSAIPEFKYYGGRGIVICDRWTDFWVFAADMGERPSARHSLDRINGDGNYEPGNCRWATQSEQLKNRRPPAYVVVELDGEKDSLTSWARRYGNSPGTVASRIARGWEVVEAIKTPSVYNRKRKGMMYRDRPYRGRHADVANLPQNQPQPNGAGSPPV